MTTTDHTMDGYDSAPKRGVIGFVVLFIIALGVCALALYKGDAPIKTADPENWMLWMRAAPTWAGVMASGLVLLVTATLGWLGRAFAPSEPKPARPAELRPVAPALSPVPSAHPGLTIAATAPAALAADDALSIPAALSRAADAPKPALAPMATTGEEPAPQLFAESPALEVRSLEPAIFHDNASDSFMTREPVAAPVASVVQDLPTAQVIPFRPDVVVPTHDPVEAALLADSKVLPTPTPPSDMNAVIASALHFATPMTEPVQVPAPTPEPTPEPTIVAVAPAIVTEPAVVAAPVTVAPVEAVAPVFQPFAAPEATDDQSEIRQAVSMALSVWPDATRSIAADELSVRVAHLYYDRSPESANAFHLIASGDLKGAALAVQAHAEALAAAGRSSEAAEKWRIIGAFNMGRDDSRAMAAYEKVSELDAADSNIHLYLARRFQMSGDTAKLPAVLGRALAVISDPQTRVELLTPYADLKMKEGDTRAAGDAFEELSRLHETSAYLKPDDVATRSAYAITLARLAQAREMHGAFDVAGPLYKKAHQVFADLSARKPEHPGLRAMADNALKDAQRFSQG